MRDIWEDVETEKKKVINKKKIIILVIVFIMIISILTLIILYFASKDFREYVDINIFNKEVHQDLVNTIDIDDDNSKIMAFNNSIGVLSKNQFKIYNVSGNLEKTLDIEVSNPLYCVNNRYMAIGEKLGKNFYVIEDKKIAWNTQIEGELAQVHINKNGYVALVISGTSYKTVVTVFDNKGNQLFSKYLSSTRLADICISNDNKYLALAEVDTSGSFIQSNIKMISVADPKNTEEKTYKGEVNSLITNIKFQDNDSLICMYDNSISIINNDNAQVLLDLNNQKISYMSIELNNNIVYLKEQSSGLFTADTIVSIIDTSNLNTKEYKISDVTKEIYTFDGVIALNLGSAIEFINTDGWLIKRYIAKQEITNAVISNSIAAIIYRDKIEIVNL